MAQTYAHILIGGSRSPTNYTETTTAQFTGSFYNTDTSGGNYVRLTQTNPAFTGSQYITSGTDFNGSKYNTITSGASLIKNIYLAGSLIEYWQYNETSGTTTAAAQITAANTAILNSGAFFNNSTFKLGGGAIEFDGSNDVLTVSIASGTALNVTGACSFAFWVYPYALPANNAFYNLHANRWANAGSRGYNFDLNNAAGTQKVRFFTGAGGAIASANYTLAINAWNHIAGTNDASFLYLYVNGSLLASGAGAGAGSSDATTAWGYLPGFARHLSGLIDDMRVYNYALSTTEIGSIYNSNSPLEYTTAGSYLHTFGIAGSYWNIGSIIWNSTSGSNQIVQAQYQTAGSNAAFGAWSSYTTGSAIVIAGSNIGSVNMMFLISGAVTTSASLDNSQLDFNLPITYATTGSYLVTKDLSGTQNVIAEVMGIVWTSGGTGPVNVDYRFSSDLVTFTSYANNATGSIAISGNYYRYVQLRFNMSGNGVAE